MEPIALHPVNESSPLVRYRSATDVQKVVLAGDEDQLLDDWWSIHTRSYQVSRARMHVRNFFSPPAKKSRANFLASHLIQ